MFRATIHIAFMLLVTTGGFAQGVLQGEVTFITANNVYVRFESTASISVGDTLVSVKGDVAVPCLVVGSKSSTSCVCTPVSGCKPQKGEAMQFMDTRPPAVERKRTGRGSFTDLPPELLVDDSMSRNSRERIRGRISAASYSTLSSEREDDHRVMYRFALTADHIRNSKFSAETYLNYRHLYPADLERHPQQTTFFNVFNLALTYRPDSTAAITLGRKINVNASSIGAIDGLQMEKSLGKLYAGAIVGFRPDFVDHGLNFELPQLGAYVGTELNSDRVRSRTTLGLMQQNNGGQVDRRYTYFQHSSTINRDLNLFSSFELDIYNKVNGVSVSGARLTNFFLSARYRFSSMVDVFGSFDSRRNVVYFETYRTDVEMLLDDDVVRQGARFRVNVRPYKEMNVGVSYSQRIEGDASNGSNNLNGYVNFSRVPGIGGRWSVQLNRNTSSYLRSDVFSLRHSRTLLKRKLNANLYFRVANYTYTTRTDALGDPMRMAQQYYGADLAYSFARKLVFSVLGEMAVLGDERNFRINTSIIKRFDSKK
jgi:hypothetical protein